MFRQLVLAVLAQAAPAPPQSRLAASPQAVLALTVLGSVGCYAVARGLRAAALGGAAGCWLSLVLSLTVLRGGYAWDLAGFGRCATTQPSVLSPDGLTNLLLFAPAAFLAVLAIGRVVHVVSGMTVLSLGVEAVQAVSSVGVCDTSDVLLNALGATFAGCAAFAARSLLGRSTIASMSGSDPCPRSS